MPAVEANRIPPTHWCTRCGNGHDQIHCMTIILSAARINIACLRRLGLWTWSRVQLRRLPVMHDRHVGCMLANVSRTSPHSLNCGISQLLVSLTTAAGVICQRIVCMRGDLATAWGSSFVRAAPSSPALTQTMLPGASQGANLRVCAGWPGGLGVGRPVGRERSK